MKKKFLRPNQIITLRDYPLYNEQILKIYFRIFNKKQGIILPPSPVIHKSVGIPYLKSKGSKSRRYNEVLSKYLKENPHAEYFLLDGGHKTTAATLSHSLIPVWVIEKDQDFQEAKKLIKTGELFGWYKTGETVKSALDELAKHHFGTKNFLTVEDKTKVMVKKRDIPDYMISTYKRKIRSWSPK